MRTPRGFTLAELLVSLVIVSIVLVAVASVFIGVQASYESISRSKSSIEASRASATYIDRTVRLAGYGLDPRFAVDFVVGGTHLKDNEEVSGFDGADGGVVVVTDDLAYRYRDPNWLRRGGVSGVTLTVPDKFGVPFRAGQRFIVACGGMVDWTVVELNAVVADTATSATVTAVTAPFPNSTESCLSVNSGAQAGYVMALHERRVRIREIDGRPFLVVYRRIGNADGTMAEPSTLTDYDPIAADVEEFQVSYVMNRPPDQADVAGAYRSRCCDTTAAPDATGNDNWVLLDDASETDLTTFLPDVADTPPGLETPYDDPTRYNKHPANVRQVRISLVSRSARQDTSKRRDSSPLALENYARGGIKPDGFFRIPATFTIPLANMQSRSGFTPDLRTTDGEGNFNGG